MPSLKKRFPIYSKLLYFYPKAYQRQYSKQTLQTMADILDDKDNGAFERVKIWLRATIDLLKTIPYENLRAVDPKKFIPRSLVISFVLLLPLAFSLIYSAMASTTETINPGILLRLINSTTLFWFAIFPICAALIAVCGIIVWRMNKPKNQNTLKPQTKRLPVFGLSLIATVSVLYIGFLLVVTSSWVINGHQINNRRKMSVEYQIKNPTLACQLLPEGQAKSISGDKIYLDNTAIKDTPYSGILSDDKDLQVTQCQYIDGNILALNATVKSPKTTNSSEKLHNDFTNNVQYGENQITLHGRNGYYMYDIMKFVGIDGKTKGTFYLRLWVDGHWLEVTAPDFAKADKAMAVMIGNLDRQISASKQAAIDTLPNNIEDLTNTERMAISQAVQNQEPTITASTNYTVNIDGISGKQITGSFSYATGLHGTFAVEKHQNSWQIVSYKKS